MVIYNDAKLVIAISFLITISNMLCLESTPRFSTSDSCLEGVVVESMSES